MNRLCETDAVVLPVVDRVIELHEDVTDNIHLLEPYLANVQLGDNVIALPALGIIIVQRPCNPVMGRYDVVYAIDNIGNFWEAERIIFRARNLNFTKFTHEVIVVTLRERGH